MVCARAGVFLFKNHSPQSPCKSSVAREWCGSEYIIMSRLVSQPASLPFTVVVAIAADIISGWLKRLSGHSTAD